MRIARIINGLCGFGPETWECNLFFGIWNLEFGIWNLEFGIWNLEFGI
jgi:hypothetical protein